MKIERKESEISFILNTNNLSAISLQKIADYISYIETVNNSKISEDQINLLAEESKNRWWQENKARFIK